MKGLKKRLEARRDRDAIKKHYNSQVDAFIAGNDPLIPLIVILVKGLKLSCFCVPEIESPCDACEALQALEEYLK